MLFAGEEDSAGGGELVAIEMAHRYRAPLPAGHGCR